MRFSEQKASALRERYNYLVGRIFFMQGKEYKVKDINLFCIMSMYGNDYCVRVLLEPQNDPSSISYQFLDDFLEKANIEFEPSDFH